MGIFVLSKGSTRSCLSTGTGSGLQGDPGVESLGKQPVSACPELGTGVGPGLGGVGKAANGANPAGELQAPEDPNVQISVPSDTSS